MAKKVSKNIFELNYRPENVKEIEKTVFFCIVFFFFIWLGSFLVCKQQIVRIKMLFEN